MLHKEMASGKVTVGVPATPALSGLGFLCSEIRFVMGAILLLPSLASHKVLKALRSCRKELLSPNLFKSFEVGQISLAQMGSCSLSVLGQIAIFRVTAV